MRTALITTTINVPHVLKLYRAFDQTEPQAHFFVAGDEKTPIETREFCDSIPDCTYLAPDQPLSWKISPLLGWNAIQRRNIATLEALKWGAEIIISVDDDNIAMDPAHFEFIKDVFDHPFDGIKAESVTGWFDVGALLVPPAKHRGFPHTVVPSAAFQFVAGAKVGVAAGICMGDPDVDATMRIESHPIVHGVSELLRAGIVVDLGTRTVFNSQNTAFLRELAPAMLMLPKIGRYDDIFASLIAQRVMRMHDLVVHFGRPFVWQQRNAHNLVKDLRDELLGMEHVVDFAEWLDRIDISGSTVLDQVWSIYDKITVFPWMPSGTKEVARAWFEDLEKVL